MKFMLVDLTKIILACAVASACIAPLLRLADIGISRTRDLLVPDAIIVSLVWILFAILLIRPGARRDLLIHVLAAFAVIVPTGYVTWWCVHDILPGSRRWGWGDVSRRIPRRSCWR